MSVIISITDNKLDSTASSKTTRQTTYPYSERHYQQGAGPGVSGESQDLTAFERTRRRKSIDTQGKWLSHERSNRPPNKGQSSFDLTILDFDDNSQFKELSSRSSQTRRLLRRGCAPWR